MHGVGVGGGMHGHRGDTKFLARAQDAQCDFAAVGYEDFVEHVVPKRRMVKMNWSPLVIRLYSTITSGSPNSTGWPSSTRICVTVPARVEGSGSSSSLLR